jgi:hypothetical protein
MGLLREAENCDSVGKQSSEMLCPFKISEEMLWKMKYRCLDSMVLRRRFQRNVLPDTLEFVR